MSKINKQSKSDSEVEYIVPAVSEATPEAAPEATVGNVSSVPSMSASDWYGELVSSVSSRVRGFMDSFQVAMSAASASCMASGRPVYMDSCIGDGNTCDTSDDIVETVSMH